MQGFLELVERDAAAIWWYNRLHRPGVDLGSAGNPYLDACVDHYRELGRRLHVLDITSDLGIPVFVAISQNLDPRGAPETLYAFGAHVEAGIALERAVIELNQLLPAAQKNAYGYLTQDPGFREWLTTARTEALPYLRPATGAQRDLNVDFPALCPPTICDSIRLLQRRVEARGMEVLVLDLTQPDIGMPVVRVLVPGLRHMWRRTAPGRLYDVPVAMGWRGRQLREDELNPVGIFI